MSYVLLKVLMFMYRLENYFFMVFVFKEFDNFDDGDFE